MLLSRSHARIVLGLLVSLVPGSVPLAQSEFEIIVDPAASFPAEFQHRFGAQVALDGDRILVRVPNDDDGRGTVRLLERELEGWVEAERWFSGATSGIAYQEFGFSLDLEGGLAVVGSPSCDGLAVFSGRVYVYTESELGWTDPELVFAADSTDCNRFGSAVDLEGTRLVVGADRDDGTGNNNGAVYVFEEAGEEWVQVAKLAASDTADSEFFGGSVAQSRDWILVGDRRYAYFFELVGSTWVERQKLDSWSWANPGLASVSVALLEDRAVVATPFGSDAGVWVFEYDGSSWVNTAQLVSDGPSGEFGAAVVLLEDRILVADPKQDLPADLDAGTVHSFAYRSGEWVQQRIWTASSPNDQDLLGSSLAANDHWVVAGAPWRPAFTQLGAVFAFAQAPQVEPYGCGTNPEGSLAQTGGSATLGDALTLGIGSPGGIGGPGAPAAYLAVGFGPDPGFPCGSVLPGWGLTGAGSDGELLVQLGSGFLGLLEAGLRAGGGVAVEATIPIPADAVLLGTKLYAQGVVLDPTPGANPFGLTNGLRIAVAP